MVNMILDGCKTTEEAKKKVEKPIQKKRKMALLHIDDFGKYILWIIKRNDHISFAKPWAD